MFTCTICKDNAVELDDVKIKQSMGRCICLFCYLHQTEQPAGLPKNLRRQVEEILAALA